MSKVLVQHIMYLVFHVRSYLFSFKCFSFFCFFFFFSSRRRHTRFDCDWSSDVCSSDLMHYAMTSGCSRRQLALVLPEPVFELGEQFQGVIAQDLSADGKGMFFEQVAARSEERRVGKECRSGWARER